MGTTNFDRIECNGLTVAGASFPSGSGTSYYVDGTNGSDTFDGLTWDFALATIAAAITAASAGDTIYIAPGSYDEQVTVSKAKLTLVGSGNRGTVSVAPSASNPTAVKVTVDDVTLINIGCEGDGTGGGLHLQGDVDRFRAYGCKIEGGTFAAKLERRCHVTPL